jgi:hypothetical protein
MEVGPSHFREVRRLVFDVLSPEQVKALKQVTGRINAGLLDETSLGTLARRTRERSKRQSSSPPRRFAVTSLPRSRM